MNVILSGHCSSASAYTLFSRVRDRFRSELFRDDSLCLVERLPPLFLLSVPMSMRDSNSPASTSFSGTTFPSASCTVCSPTFGLGLCSRLFSRLSLRSSFTSASSAGSGLTTGTSSLRLRVLCCLCSLCSCFSSDVSVTFIASIASSNLCFATRGSLFSRSTSSFFTLSLLWCSLFSLSSLW